VIRGFILWVALWASLWPLTGSLAGDHERLALSKAARDYFQAEVDRDMKKVWGLLAPSSEFKKTHTLDKYIKLAEETPIRIKSFKIETVAQIEENTERQRMPGVEKIGYVRVFVIIGGPEFPDSERHITMTFLKEGGKWYKG
jgi:hypothetical protein